jgi:hypothetical protein
MTFFQIDEIEMAPLSTTLLRVYRARIMFVQFLILGVSYVFDRFSTNNRNLCLVEETGSHLRSKIIVVRGY